MRNFFSRTAAAICMIIMLAATACAYVYVDGYYKSDGTYVPGYYRTEADNNLWNNFSTKGNVNPFTGKEGYKLPSLYPSAAPTHAPTQNEYLGSLSTNPYLGSSVANPYGTYGSKYGDTINNPYSTYGSKYSGQSWTNPYAYNTPKIYSSDGAYLGKLSTNKYDYESISNPYGPYGSKYSSTSIWNEYGTYGNPYSSNSWSNPYATNPPVIIAPSGY